MPDEVPDVEIWDTSKWSPEVRAIQVDRAQAIARAAANYTNRARNMRRRPGVLLALGALAGVLFEADQIEADVQGKINQFAAHVMELTLAVLDDECACLDPASLVGAGDKTQARRLYEEARSRCPVHAGSDR